MTKKKDMPFITEVVKAGFPNPAQDLPDEKLSLEDLLIKNPSSTFYMRVDGDSMIEKGITPGDILVVDKSLSPKSNDIVIAQIDGEFTLKTFIKQGNKGLLRAANPNFSDLVISDESDFVIWGVVVASVTSFN